MLDGRRAVLSDVGDTQAETVNNRLADASRRHKRLVRGGDMVDNGRKAPVFESIVITMTPRVCSEQETACWCQQKDSYIPAFASPEVAPSK